METTNLSNQTPEQVNIPEKEESTEISANGNQETESLLTLPAGEAISEDALPLAESLSEDALPLTESLSEDALPLTESLSEDALPLAESLSEDALPLAESLSEDVLPLAESLQEQPPANEAEPDSNEENKPSALLPEGSEKEPEADNKEKLTDAEAAPELIIASGEEISKTGPATVSSIEETPTIAGVIETIAEEQTDTISEIEAESEELKPADEVPEIIADEKNPDEITVTSEDKESISVKTEDEKDDTDEEDEEDEETGAIYQNLSRTELIDLIEASVQEQDIQAIKIKVALMKVAYLQKEKEEQQAQYDSFLNEGGIPENYSPETDPLNERFQLAFNIYREKRQRHNEELEKDKLVNLEAKKKILEELKTLISSEETLKKTYDEFKALQEQWRHIGMVPKNEINQLWQNYHFLVEKFFDKVKINKELKDLDLRKNLERKIELCEKAEELLIENSVLNSFKQLQKYHDDWKEVGPVPQDKKDEIWERFKIASNQINERRRDYYNEKQEELDNNYLAKSALCEKAEKMISHNPETLRQWQNRTNDVNDLLRVWKTIGPCPKKVNSEVWNRFKTCLDSHFTSYKEYLDKLKDQQLNNYNLKLDLCAQAESIQNSTDWRKTTQELIQLQQEWKLIGAVPRKHSDKIWKRFRTACDEFFKRKTEFFSSVAQVEDDNMKKKEDMIKRLQEVQFSANRSDNLEILKNFQREWLEIGHVPIREKDRLQNEFRIALNKHFDRLKIDASEVNALNYKNRMESIKDMPDSGRVIFREKNALQLKATKLQEDIKLWENNIGYLTESKNANLVKVEFQKKIDQAKQELALMEAKLRYLKDI